MKKGIPLLLILAAAVALSGCGAPDPGEELLVAGAAFDRTENGEYLVTVEIVTADDKNGNVGSALVSDTGKTPLAAIRGMIARSSGRLYFGHCKILVIGEEAARYGISDVLDLVFRDREIRFSMNIAAAHGCRAADLLGTKPASGRIVSFALADTVTAESRRVGAVPDTRICGMINDLGSDAGKAVIPAFSLARAPSGEDVFSLDGAAVFSGGVLTAYIPNELSVFCMIASGDFRSGIVTCVLPSGEALTLNVLKCRSRSGSDENGVFIRADMDVSFTEFPESGMTADELTEAVGAYLSERVEKTAESVLFSCGNVFGFPDGAPGNVTAGITVRMQDSGLAK